MNPKAQEILDQLTSGTKVEIHYLIGKNPEWYTVQHTEVAEIKGKSVHFANGSKVQFRGLHRAIVIVG